MAAVVILLMIMQGVLAREDLTVTIQQGTLVGVEKVNRLNKEPYYAFLGIPYAKPPVGEKRFKDPEPALPWNGILNATEEGSPCMTYNVIFKYAEGSEDCLNLHVFTSKKPKDLQTSPRPVMVWIHGGGFMSGSGRPSDYGPDMLMLQDIVLVNINYRLNVFGFLSVQHDNVPGNAGLKDQVMALKWVQENIRQFGGDPDKVTIFGESAGGASVHYLMLSPSAKGLFHRAIAQSGVAINPWASIKHSLETAYKIGEVFDCNTKNPYELVDCLQQVKAKDLVAYQFNILSMKSDEFLTKSLSIPCIEPQNSKHAFIKEHPINIIKRGDFNDVPLILGVLRVETLLLDKLFTEEAIPQSVRNLVIAQMNKKPELLLPGNLNYETPEKKKRIGQIMREFYFKDKPISRDTSDNLINATSDSWFNLGVHDTALLHSLYGNSSVYLYHFILETKFGESEKAIAVDKPGPSHADDLKYFFYVWQKEIKIQQEEMEKISKIDNLWVNFARTGNPTPENADSGLVWEPFNQEKQSYLEIGEEFILKTHMEKERMEFWGNLIATENLTYF